MKTVRDIGEFGLIAQLRKDIPLAGDDCAVLPSHRDDTRLLLTCDPVVEGIHYLAGTSPYRVGWKAMARNLSDIAAMGGQPRWAVVSIGLRSTTPVSYVKRIYAGIHAVARAFNCQVVGGDTCHVRQEPFIVITVLGEVERHRLTRRAGSKPGDLVFVTGKLGNSFRSSRHLTFTPRVTEARWLTQHFRIRAMMDISDGLGSDIFHMITPGIGFELSTASIPANKTVHSALHDGEDFELLFTVRPQDAGALKQKWPFKIRLTHIGRVVRAPGTVTLVDATGTKHFLPPRGYDHFAKRR
jgi:thiamine-monophosphate kinase